MNINNNNFIKLRSRFTLHFLRALRKINQTQNNKNNNINSENINININDNIMVCKRYRKVKLAASTSLATAVGPKRAWARALLMKARCGRRGREKGMRRRVFGRMSAGQGRGRGGELRRLVPGGEGMDMQSLIGETLHYVVCLATQVKVMRNIVDLYSSTNTTTTIQ